MGVAVGKTDGTYVGVALGTLLNGVDGHALGRAVSE